MKNFINNSNTKTILETMIALDTKIKEENEYVSRLFKDDVGLYETVEEREHSIKIHSKVLDRLRSRYNRLLKSLQLK